MIWKGESQAQTRVFPKSFRTILSLILLEAYRQVGIVQLSSSFYSLSNCSANIYIRCIFGAIVQATKSSSTVKREGVSSTGCSNV